MKNIYNICYLLMLSLAFSAGCTKDDTEFKDFLKDGENIYPGKVSVIVPQPGNLRVGLVWPVSPDPSITKYVIYWNNKKDSMTVDGVGHAAGDSVRVVIPGLEEYTYSFVVQSMDAQGHKSVPFEINNVRVYGALYQSGLLNRPYNAANPSALSDEGDLTLNFNTPDTININTIVRYTNNAGVLTEKILLPKDSTITLPDYKAGTAVTYRSSYIPGKGALDVFQVTDFSTFPDYVYKDVACDKSLFRQVQLPNDVYADFGTSMAKLWDGSVGPQEYPDVFHSNGVTMPHHFTFDLGRSYRKLSFIEETGRQQAHNPVEFEVWGINDITNAATTLASNDAGWAAESVAKGWTLLANVARTDDGRNLQRFKLMDNPPSVRYIRIRVKRVASGDSSYSNISEITLFNNQ